MSVHNLATLYSAELEGVDARLIEVEVDLNVGLHAFTIVGLADKALNEARERVNSALKNSGVKPPNRENRRITINLAPADVRKSGSQYDVAIALGYLVATQQIAPFEIHNKIFIGELALDGRVRPVAGILSIAEMAGRLGFSEVYVPKENAREASVVSRVSIIPVSHLKELIAHLEQKELTAPAQFSEEKEAVQSVVDFSEVRGQEHAKRALIIAAAGGHNVLLVGSPGVGKSLLAQALPGILPPLHIEEAIEVTKIHSAAGFMPQRLMTARPFRAPHHTASPVAVVGGGPQPKPGEISLAHRGVLFLDEVPEFQRSVLEALRQPLENGTVNISRARGTLTFPARFTLIAAMNPCPCGFFGDSEKECQCGAHEIIRYQKKISGPLLDRIDLQVRVSRVALEMLQERGERPKESPDLREKITRIRTLQKKRFQDIPIQVNAEMSSAQVEEFAPLTSEARDFLTSLKKHHLSPRSYYRLIKTARTIADLEEKGVVDLPHVAEAFSYRIREE